MFHIYFFPIKNGYHFLFLVKVMINHGFPYSWLTLKLHWNYYWFWHCWQGEINIHTTINCANIWKPLPPLLTRRLLILVYFNLWHCPSQWNDSNTHLRTLIWCTWLWVEIDKWWLTFLKYLDQQWITFIMDAWMLWRWMITPSLVLHKGTKGL